MNSEPSSNVRIWYWQLQYSDACLSYTLAEGWGKAMNKAEAMHDYLREQITMLEEKYPSLKTEWQQVLDNVWR